MPRREPPIEYAAMNMRTEICGQINRQERQRLEFLLDRGRVFGLDGDELAELAYLRFLDGTGPAVPAVKIRDGGTTSTGPAAPQRSMTPQQRMVQLYEMRWPKIPLSGKQAQLELLRMRGVWYLTAKQRQLQRLRQSWAWQP
jgi:hypothetical protein